jgi:hypothetical protein
MDFPSSSTFIITIDNTLQENILVKSKRNYTYATKSEDLNLMHQKKDLKILCYNLKVTLLNVCKFLESHQMLHPFVEDAPPILLIFLRKSSKFHCNKRKLKFYNIPQKH